MNWSRLFFTVDGRIGRRTYWLGFGLPAALLVLGLVAILPPEPSPVVFAAMILCLLAAVPVGVKRCHDRNRRGWFLLVGLIPFVGPLWLLIELGFLRGTLGPNRYGFDPLLRPPPGKAGPAAIGQRFRVIGGDGDQNFFSNAGVMRLAEADWFPGRIGEFGEALLLVIETGPFAGEYIALTSRVLARLEGQIAHHGSVSAVVHRISNPTANFDGGKNDSRAIGMAGIERIP